MSNTLAHTGAVRLIVEQKQIRSARDTEALIEILKTQQEHYRTKGRYRQSEDRQRMVGLFESAIERLELQR